MMHVQDIMMHVKDIMMHVQDIMMHVKDIVSKSRNVQYIGVFNINQRYISLLPT